MGTEGTSGVLLEPRLVYASHEAGFAVVIFTQYEQFFVKLCSLAFVLG